MAPRRRRLRVSVTPTPAGPALALSGSKPIVVHGSRFTRNEAVKVTFRVGGVVVARTVRTTTAGAFALPAPLTLGYDPCSTTLVITARGTSGELVTVKRPPRGCAPG